MKGNISFGPEQSLDDETLRGLAEEFGTPLYVYDGDLILKRYNELHQFIKWPKLRILYAMKANYNVAILKLLNEAILNAGAYCYAMGGIYNLRPMPAEVMIGGGIHRLITKRLTDEGWRKIS